MKRLTSTLFAILNVASSPFALQQFDQSKQSGLPCEILLDYNNLWKDSGFGQDPNRTERSAWIAQHTDGKFECRRWPRSSARNKEFWTGPVPDYTVAQAHTHTASVDPKPSQNDRTFSIRTGIPLFTISGAGIWKITPDGIITKQADQAWWIGLDKKQCDERE